MHLTSEIGTDFVGYRIEELIGRGGMGVVYRASDLRLKRTVALKLVAPEFALDERFRTRFARETELVMSLEHPNVVPVYDAGDVDGRLYISMRLVEGADLRTMLRNDGPLPPARIVALCRQVAAALDAAHARGLVHRDVKPSNVLVDPNDHVYVADLGLSRRLGEHGVEQSVGTPAYLAPEHIEGVDIDGRADVYSLGCMLYECLTGELPFARTSRLATAWAHLEEEPPRASARNANLPQAIDVVLAKALAKTPGERYPSCAALVDAAQAALGLGRPAGLRRRRLLLVATAVAAAMAAAATAVALTRGGGAAAALVARPNSLVRIDPATNKVRDVVDLQYLPAATAVGGGRVWVYNVGPRTLSEIDATTAVLKRTIRLVSAPISFGLPRGPVLAGYPHGAWIIGVDDAGVGAVTNVQPGRRARSFRVGVEPKSVAVGEGAVWVLGSARGRDELVKIDPATGRVTGRRRFGATFRLDNVNAGVGAVWLGSSVRATLYRVDPRTLAVTGHVNVNGAISRVYVFYRQLWLALDEQGTQTLILDPRSLRRLRELNCCPPKEGAAATGFGSTWTVSWPTGVVVRFDAVSKQPLATVHVVAESPFWGGPCITSIAAGAGSMWVTVAPSSGWSCAAI
jgi:hypothetical protein